jgi:membrane protein
MADPPSSPAPDDPAPDDPIPNHPSPSGRLAGEPGRDGAARAHDRREGTHDASRGTASHGAAENGGLADGDTAIAGGDTAVAGGPFALLKQTISEFSADNCTRMAAALAYYTVFSLPPLLVVLITVAGLVLDPAEVQVWITGQAGQVVGPQVARQLRTMSEAAQARVEGGFSLGLILSIAGLLFGATGAFAQLQDALNTAWEVQPDPEQSGLVSFVMKRVLSLGMILVIAFLLLVTLLVSAVISTLGAQLGTLFAAVGLGAATPVVAWALNLAVSLSLVTLLFAAMFKVLPDADIRWRDVRVGAFATAVLFVVGKSAIALYLGQSTPGEAYGAAAALALLLVWVYYSAMIVFLGAEFTQVWARRHGTGIQPTEGAVKVTETTQPAA